MAVVVVVVVFGLPIVDPDETFNDLVLDTGTSLIVCALLILGGVLVVVRCREISSVAVKVEDEADENVISSIFR